MRKIVLLGCVAASAALLAPGSASAYTTTQLDSTAPINRSVGRLFIVSQVTGPSRCSAAVVDAPNRSTIVTAGHCLATATDGPTLSATFVPGYHDGVKPFGEFAAVKFSPAPQWAGAYNRRYDYGFVVVGRSRSGAAVQNVVGALPIAFNQPRPQSYRILGLPAQPTPPYDGQKLWACDTTFTADFLDAFTGPPRMSAECDFGVSSSGGPWVGAGGAVASVSATRTNSGPSRLTAPYLDGDAAALFATVKDISTAPPVTKKCKKKKKRKGRSAVAAAAKKKCKAKRKRR